METKKQHVKTAKGRSASSTRWLQRQLNDPYVKKAQEQGFRGRAAFKLLQINEKFHLLKPGQIVIDLGCAPGGWSQVATQLTKSSDKKPCVFGIDLLPTSPVAGAVFMQGDFSDPVFFENFQKILPDQKADIILSDMAPNTSGIPSVDHLRLMNLLELAYDFACHHLKENGSFIAKIFQGGTDNELLNQIKLHFKTVKHFKPDASRKESVEYYIVAQGFKNET